MIANDIKIGSEQNPASQFILPMLISKIKSIDSSAGVLSIDQIKRLLAEKINLDPLKFIENKTLSII